MRNFGIMKISLITITYNSEKTLADTLQSVLKQTYPQLEYIVVDGASQDNTLSIIQQYEPLFDGKLKWISEPDKGLYDALNKGINMATGDVIGILNSDDFFTSNDILEKIADAFIIYPETDAVYGDVHFVHPDDLNKCVRYYSSQIFKRELMRMGFMPAHLTKSLFTPAWQANISVNNLRRAYDTRFIINRQPHSLRTIEIGVFKCRQSLDIILCK